MASSSGSSATLGSSQHSNTDAEVAALQLRSALDDANAKIMALETASQLPLQWSHLLLLRRHLSR